MKRTTIISYLAILFAFALCQASAADKAQNKTWTDPDTALKEDPDFSIQGEYRVTKGSTIAGVQVVALGNGKFHAYLLQDGLPGQGWTPEKTRILLEGARKGDKTTFASVDKKITASIEGTKMHLTNVDGKKLSLTRVNRLSPTIGAKPPVGAIVLFDGTTAEHWEKGKLVNGNLLAAGCTSKQTFKGYTLHLEFRTPYKPHALGQKRGNSGIYHSGRWETQILDSFGLDGKDNECGGIYSVSKPRLNMCLPPLSWQTYDVVLTAAKFDSEGNRTDWPRITVKLNGVLVHDDLELKKDNTASAPAKGPLKDTEGPIFIQDHGNPVVFRNIWVIPE